MGFNGINNISELGSFGQVDLGVKTDIKKEVIKLAETIQNPEIKTKFLEKIEEVSDQKLNIEVHIQEKTKEKLINLKNEIKLEIQFNNYLGIFINSNGKDTLNKEQKNKLEKTKESLLKVIDEGPGYADSILQNIQDNIKLLQEVYNYYTENNIPDGQKIAEKFIADFNTTMISQINGLQSFINNIQNKTHDISTGDKNLNNKSPELLEEFLNKYHKLNFDGKGGIERHLWNETGDGVDKINSILELNLFTGLDKSEIYKKSMDLLNINFEDLKEIKKLQNNPEELVKKVEEINKKTIINNDYRNAKEILTTNLDFIKEALINHEFKKSGIDESKIQGNDSLRPGLLIINKLDNPDIKNKFYDIYKLITSNEIDENKRNKVLSIINQIDGKYDETKLFKQKGYISSLFDTILNKNALDKEFYKLEYRFDKSNINNELDKKIEEIRGKDPEYMLGIPKDFSYKDNPNKAYEIIDDFYLYNNQTPKPESKEQKPEQKSVDYSKIRDMGIPMNDKGEIDMKKGEKISIGKNKTATLEISETGEYIITNQLGYNFKYSNENFGKDGGPNKIAPDEIDNFYQITEKMDVLDRAGFGYFGEDFKPMIDTIIANSSLINSVTGISIKESIGYNNDFLNDTEIALIFNIFYKLGFLPNNSSYYTSSLNPDLMTKNNFISNISNIEKKIKNEQLFIHGIDDLIEIEW